MRPFKGVVVKVRKGYMKIELESGNTITTKKVGGLTRGSKVDVLYDFTRNRVRDVWLENCQPVVSLPEELEEEVKEEEGDREFSAPVFNEAEEPGWAAFADDDRFGKEEEDEEDWQEDNFLCNL